MSYRGDHFTVLFLPQGKKGCLFPAGKRTQAKWADQENGAPFSWTDNCGAVGMRVVRAY